MRKLMNKALLMAFTAVLIVFSLIATDVSIVFAAPDENRKHTERTSSTPEIEIVYETGTQNGAKERRDEEEASRNEDDGSYEVFVPEGSISGNVTVTDNETGEDSKIQWEDIHIKTPEDFSEFCKNCRVDTWSVNKNVYLDNDIILTSAEYNSVPTFGGHFYGNNYTISGYTMYEARSYTGLFCYTQKTAVIDSVVLKATVSSKGKQIVTGGLVGENHGEIRNCVFDGSVKGQNYVGGIAGYNELTGIIINCRAIGSVLGTYYTGGIAGENVGNISSCVNEAEVNTVNIDRVASVQEIDLSSYADSIISKFTGNTEEKKANTSVVDSGCVDAGGIAGLSIGVIQFCENKGQVGYEHVGYNIGGIVGRQSGYVHGCTNSGIVKGRKDVGGIVGQAEPYVVVDFTEDTITKLSENIDKLHDIIENTLSDAGDSSDTISNRLSIVKEFTDRALDQTSFLSDHTIDWTNGMVSAGNELMGRASYIMSESSKNGGPLDNSKDAFNETKDAANHLNDTVNDLDIYKYMSDSQKASYDDAKDRFNTLSKSISDNEIKYTKAAENYYIYKMLDADIKSTDSKYLLSHDLNAFDAKGIKIDSDVMSSTYGEDLDNWSKVSSWRHGTTADAPLIGERDDAKESDAKLVNDANTAYTSATAPNQPNQTEVSEKSKQKAVDEYNNKYGTSISRAEVDSELANQALIMSGIIAAVTPEMDKAAKKDADKAADSLKDASEHLSDAGSQTKSIISDIASRGDITMPTLGDDYKNATNALNAALQGMSDNMGALNIEMSDSSDIMIDNMGDVNDQFNVIMQLYTDAIDGVIDGDYGENVEDTSMEVAATCVDATIADCNNKGKTEGDINVSGIAGSMGIEYDFDLESDITKSDDSKLTSTYQSKCVLRNNRNNAHVIAQKSYAGGICGLQEIGTILSCENYGKVKSNSSDYVGGICGDSLSYIQKSVAKCFLQGKNYVGGIAGHGCNILNCYSMVQIDEDFADSFYGAIAGDIVSEGKVRYNYFVGDSLAGIDRVSFTGQAEPISYETFIGIDSVPKECTKLYAVFYIDDVETGRIETEYGGSVYKEQFPKDILTDDDDTYCYWNKGDITNMHFDEEVEGEYKRYKTSLAGDQLRLNDQSAILVDGKFTEDDKLSSTLWGNKDIPLDNVLEHWELSYPSSVNEKHLIRYKEPENIDSETAIYINNAGKWEKTDTGIFGTYKTFTIAGGHVEFAVVMLKANNTRTIIFTVISILIAALLIMLIIKIIKSKKHGKPDDISGTINNDDKNSDSDIEIIDMNEEKK